MDVLLVKVFLNIGHDDHHILVGGARSEWRGKLFSFFPGCRN